MNESINPESGSALEADEDSQLDIPSLEDCSIAQHEIERMDVIRRFENGMYPYGDRIKKSEYEKEKALLDDKDFESVGEPDSFIVTSSDLAIARSEHILGASLHPEQRRSKRNLKSYDK